MRKKPNYVPPLAQSIEIRPNPGPQAWFIGCPITDILYAGGRGSGKTWAVLMKFMAYAEKYKGDAQGLILRKTFKELQDFREKKAKKLLPYYGWEYKVTEACWYHPNGATLREGFIDAKGDFEKYQGHEYTFIIVEEMGNFAESEELDLLRGSLRSAAGIPCFFIATANPGGAGHDWIKKRYVEPGPAMEPHQDPHTGEWRVYIHATALDNPVLMAGDPNYLKKLMLLKPHMVRAWVFGDWNATPKGHIFERGWWKYYDWNPEEITLPRIGHFNSAIPKFNKIVQSWDTAYGEEEENSKSACTTWGITDDAMYLLDVFQRRMQFPELLNTTKMLAAKWKPNVIYVEGKASGKSVVQMMRGTRLPIVEIKRVQDSKEVRAKACTPWITLGKVKLPKCTTWVHDFIEELASFPKQKSDVVDSLSQAINTIAHIEASAERRNRVQKGPRVRSYLGR